MATALKDALLDLIDELRAAGVRISIAESLDAMRAVAVSGLERARMREAMRAALIKDESDNAAFEAIFAHYFGARPAALGKPRHSRGSYIGVSGGGRGSSAGSPVVDAETASPTDQSAKFGLPSDEAELKNGRRKSEEHRPSKESLIRSGNARRSDRAAEKHVMGDDLAGLANRDNVGRGIVTPLSAGAGRAAPIREIEHKPFTLYSDLEYKQAREALAVLRRRLRVRLGRRLRLAPTGRIDIRRTIRAAIQHGGTFADLRFRARRPRHINLVILADISGSVKYASTLTLELVAGVRRCFHSVRSFVYIDRLAEADFEQGHLVMAPQLDLYARSDFGRVLAELLAEHSDLLNRATVIVIIGDGRNNRRPARADLLREIAKRSRAVIWLNPEAPERWHMGDSAIANYEREVDALIGCANLYEVEVALGRLN